MIERMGSWTPLDWAFAGTLFACGWFMGVAFLAFFGRSTHEHR